MRNVNVYSHSDRWPIRQVILGIVLFCTGIAVGYTARDWPSITSRISATDPADSPNARDDPSWGPVDAKVTIVEFADFECPACRQWYSSVYNLLYQNYRSEVRFIYRDFPLTSTHPNAQPAAIAANCANEQGRYWEYFNKLFGDPRGLGGDLYRTYAQEVGMDVAVFSNCIANNNYVNEINLDMGDAEKLTVNAVPAFFINGQILIGVQPYETFRQKIEAELKK
jgi:protein-disulfide isomerase